MKTELLKIKKNYINAFHNGDLGFEFEKHLRADEPTIEKDEYHNGEEETWCIDINDDSYFYYNEEHRDIDFEVAKNLLFPQS